MSNSLSKLYVRLLGCCKTRDPGVRVGEGTGRKAKKGQAGCRGTAISPKQGGPGAVKGKGRGGGSGTEPRPLWEWQKASR